jgi:hypothetical protein
MLPRFTITTLAWFTAIVAIAAALPRRRSLVVEFVSTGSLTKSYLTREFWPLGWELLWRGAVVVALCVIVWFFRRRGRGLPPY